MICVEAYDVVNVVILDTILLVLATDTNYSLRLLTGAARSNV